MVQSSLAQRNLAFLTCCDGGLVLFVVHLDIVQVGFLSVGQQMGALLCLFESKHYQPSYGLDGDGEDGFLQEACGG